MCSSGQAARVACFRSSYFWMILPNSILQRFSIGDLCAPSLLLVPITILALHVQDVAFCRVSKSLTLDSLGRATWYLQDGCATLAANWKTQIIHHPVLQRSFWTTRKLCTCVKIISASLSQSLVVNSIMLKAYSFCSNERFFPTQGVQRFLAMTTTLFPKIASTRN